MGDATTQVLIVADGTGGHIFPALAVAQQLQSQGFQIAWCGVQNGMAQRFVADQFPFYAIKINALRGKGLKRYLAMPFKLLGAIKQSLKLLKQLNPKIIVAMGGYSAGPMGVAARLKKIPLVIHEQNSIAGLTNRKLAKWASKVLQAFPNTFDAQTLRRSDLLATTGNPVRAELCQLPAPEQRLQNRSGPLRILVLGGSQGAHFINQQVMQLAQQLGDRVVIWHQTGKTDFQPVQDFYQQHQLEAEVMPFIDDMAKAYAWADLVIARSGALTVSELMAVGVGSLLIPFPFAVDNHQLHNAGYLEREGAAEIFVQHGFDQEHFINTVKRLAQDREKLLTMAVAAHVLAKPNAAKDVAQCCKEIINNDV